MPKKKKRCQKGYSCGYTCINVSKICRIEFPDGVSFSLDKRELVLSSPYKPQEKKSGSLRKQSIEAFAGAEKDLYKEITKEKIEARIKEIEDQKEGYKNILNSPNSIDIQKQVAKDSLEKTDRNIETLKNALKRAEEVRSKETNAAKAPAYSNDEIKSYIESGDFDKDVGTTNKARKTSWTKEELDNMRKTGPVAPFIADDYSFQEAIYEAQGFNAKPTIVDSVEDIRFNNNLLKDPSGAPLVLMRGVSSVEFQEDLKRGSTHYLGKGIYGNGTYFAASAPADVKKGDYSLEKPNTVAKNFGGNVIVAGLKKDAKVWTGTFQELTKLERKLADKYEDIDGELWNMTGLGVKMALEGYDAYLARNTESPYTSAVGAGPDDSNFWVVLNRGALVIAEGNVPADYK